MSDGTQRRALPGYKSENINNNKYFIPPSGNRTNNRRVYGHVLGSTTATVSTRNRYIFIFCLCLLSVDSGVF